MVRWVGLALVAFCSVAVADDEVFDFTCVDSGTRWRVAIFREVKGQELPCSVQAFKHPLGRYSMNWEVIWRVENQEGFCEAQVLKSIEDFRDDGWKCRQTDVWNGREGRFFR